MHPALGELNGVPRIVRTPYSYGRPCGKPNDANDQLRIIKQALDFLEEASEPGEVFRAKRR
jgi:hypothetical protein